MPFSTIIRSRLYRNVKTNYIAICQRNSPSRGSVSMWARPPADEGAGSCWEKRAKRGQPWQENCMQSNLHICSGEEKERGGARSGPDALTSFRATSLEIRNQCSERRRNEGHILSELKVCPRPAQPAVCACKKLCSCVWERERERVCGVSVYAFEAQGVA